MDDLHLLDDRRLAALAGAWVGSDGAIDVGSTDRAGGSCTPCGTCASPPRSGGRWRGSDRDPCARWSPGRPNSSTVRHRCPDRPCWRSSPAAGAAATSAGPKRAPPCPRRRRRRPRWPSRGRHPSAASERRATSSRAQRSRRQAAASSANRVATAASAANAAAVRASIRALRASCARVTAAQAASRGQHVSATRPARRLRVELGVCAEPPRQRLDALDRCQQRCRLRTAVRRGPLRPWDCGSAPLDDRGAEAKRSGSIAGWDRAIRAGECRRSCIASA